LIIPGEYLQYKSLIDNTDIKGIEEQIVHNSIIGKNTKHAITSGIKNCLLYGIEGIILKLVSEYKIDNIVITGRGSEFLKENKDALKIKTGLNIVFNDKLIYSGFVSMAKKLKIK
jgi:type III pantothenate kinase